MTDTRRGGIARSSSPAWRPLPCSPPRRSPTPKPLKRGSHGARVAKVQRWLGHRARRDLRPRHQARGQALPAQPRPDRRRHRRPGHVARAASARRARKASQRGGGKRSAVVLLQRALGIGADGIFGPATAGRRQELPAQPRPDRRRDRRPRHLERARPRRPHDDPQAPRGSRGGGLDVVARVVARGQPDPEQAVQVRRRPRALERQRLRLLGLGLLRPARRRPALVGARPAAAS